MGNRRKRTGGLLAGLVWTMALACPVVAAPTKLTFMVWGNDQVELEMIRRQAESFASVQKDVTVEVLFTSGGEQRRKLFTMHAAGVAPDVFVVNRDWQYDVWANGLLLPLTRWVKQDPQLAHLSLM